MKTPDDVGGIGPYVGLNMVAGVFVVAVYLLLYLGVYPVLPGNWLVRGLVFGAAIVLVKAVLEAFNQFMLFRYPIRLIVVQLDDRHRCVWGVHIGNLPLDRDVDQRVERVDYPAAEA